MGIAAVNNLNIYEAWGRRNSIPVIYSGDVYLQCIIKFAALNQTWRLWWIWTSNGFEVDNRQKWTTEVYTDKMDNIWVLKLNR